MQKMYKIRDCPLTTEDPYHIPRYLGHVPQYKFQIGNTFGQTTHNLLTDKYVATSGKTVLANIDMTPRKQVDDFNEPGSADKVARIERRLASYGERKYHARMVPGYTGVIPRGQHPIGKRYGQHCVNAVSDFIEQQEKRERYAKALRQESTPCSMPQRAEYTPDQIKLWVSKDRPPFPLTPYKMENENPAKHFISGYTGFVPRSRSLMGVGFPAVTHEALNKFTDEVKRQQALKTAPANIHRSPDPVTPSPLIYPQSSGMIPHYTGYIPGEKFRFGNTFGCSTIATLQKRGLRPEASS